MTRLKTSLKGIICVALAGPVLLQADEIYHWVDAAGVNHYSQSPPPAAAGSVRTLDVDGSQPASYDPEEDRYHVAAQAEATQAVRDKLAENRKNRPQESPSVPENTVVYYPEPYADNSILYPPGYRPGRPNYPNRPKPPNRPDGKPDRPSTLPEEITPPASRPFKPPGRKLP